LGINTYMYKVVSLFISTFLAGLAGGVFAYYSASHYYFSPFNLSWSFEPMLITFIGGAGTIIGPTIAVVGYIVLKGVFAATMGEMSILVFGTLFILVVLFLPGGLVEIGGKICYLRAHWLKSDFFRNVWKIWTKRGKNV
jgi:branched-chain amino acid transport system permease protein